MTQEIKLPPLPAWMDSFLLPPDDDNEEDTLLIDRMRTYARASVELNLHEANRQIAALTEDYKDLEAQQRGELAAKQLADLLLCDPVGDGLLAFAGPPETEGSWLRIRLRSGNGDDWTLTAQLKEGWLGANQRSVNFWRAAKDELGQVAPQPTEPVNMPASFDEKALSTAQEIALMWGRDRSQFVSKIQVAVADAMLWAKSGQPAASAEPVATQQSMPDTIYLGCARMGLAGASDEEVLSYVRIASRKAAAPTPPNRQDPS